MKGDSIYSFEENPEHAKQPCNLYIAEIDEETYKFGITKDLKARKSMGHYKDYIWTSGSIKRAEAFAIEYSTLLQTYFARANPEIIKKSRSKFGEYRLHKLLDVSKALDFITWNMEMVNLYGWNPWLLFYQQKRGDKDWLDKPFFLQPLGFQGDKVIPLKQL